MDKNVILRKLPRVDDLLKEESLRELCMIYGKKEVLRAVREELGCLRQRILSKPWSNDSGEEAGKTAEYYTGGSGFDAVIFTSHAAGRSSPLRGDERKHGAGDQDREPVFCKCESGI